MSTILVTGASTGIGQEAVLHMARKGNQVYAGLRNPDGADDLKEKIAAENLSVSKNDDLGTRKKIAVVGAGLMGHGIALEFAAHGHEVTINDVNEELLDSALERCEKGLELLADAGRISRESIAEALSGISASADLGVAVQDADLVIEATSEDLGLKQRIRIGPMSGKSNVAWVLERLGVEVTDELVQKVLEAGKSSKRLLTDQQVRDVIAQQPS